MSQFSGDPMFIQRVSMGGRTYYVFYDFNGRVALDSETGVPMIMGKENYDSWCEKQEDVYVEFNPRESSTVISVSIEEFAKIIEQGRKDAKSWK